MTKFAVVIAFECDEVDEAIDYRTLVQYAINSFDSDITPTHVTLHRNMLEDINRPYMPWAAVTVTPVEDDDD